MFVAFVVLSSLLVGVTPAAGGDTRCAAVFTGFADNIVVPSGAECILEGAQVLGNVLAEPESMLFIGPGTAIGGNVEVKELAHTASFQAAIGGNYKCDHCFFEDVVFTRVGGSVEIQGAQDGDFIVDNEIGGNVEIVESFAGQFAFVIAENTIVGNVKFEKNVGPTQIGAGPGPVEPLGGNTIGGDLQIYENNVAGPFCPPPPPDGEPPPCPVFENGHFNGNTVGGDMQVYKNQGPSEVTDNMIRENLQCFDNDPPPASAGNVAQEKQGQCLF